MRSIDTTDVTAGFLDELVGYHLRMTSNKFQADFAVTLAGTGIRPALFAILSIVNDKPGINQGVVGKQLGIQRANMVSLINELLEQKLIARSVSKEDRRAYRLSLSEIGRDTYIRCATAIRAHERALLANLSAKELTALITTLKKLHSHDGD